MADANLFILLSTCRTPRVSRISRETRFSSLPTQEFHAIAAICIRVSVIRDFIPLILFRPSISTFFFFFFLMQNRAPIHIIPFNEEFHAVR